MQESFYGLPINSWACQNLFEDLKLLEISIPIKKKSKNLKWRNVIRLLRAY